MSIPKEIIIITIFISGCLLVTVNLKHTKEFTDKNCGDFNSRAEMLKEFKKYDTDVHCLDGNNDGIPCESLK